MARGNDPAPAALDPPSVKAKGAPPAAKPKPAPKAAATAVKDAGKTGLAALAKLNTPAQMSLVSRQDTLYGTQQLSSLELCAAMTKEIAASPNKLTQLQVHPLVILGYSVMTVDLKSKVESSAKYLQSTLFGTDVRTERQTLITTNATQYAGLFVVGEAAAEVVSKIGEFATGYGTFVVQIGQSDTDLRQQFGGDPTSPILVDRGYGIRLSR